MAIEPTDEPRRRSVRSYVRREGRITPAQARALETLWPRYGIDFSESLLDLSAIFGRDARRCLEIGFGSGEALLWRARNEPATDFLGIEVHRPGIGRLLHALDRHGLGNVRVICHDAVEVLSSQLPPASLHEVLILFPDPWPKKRHHKRRMLQPGFVARLAWALAPGGLLHLATDWEDYALHMLEIMAASPHFERVAEDSDLAARSRRPETRFERRGRRLGHGVWDLLYRRNRKEVSDSDFG